MLQFIQHFGDIPLKYMRNVVENATFYLQQLDFVSTCPQPKPRVSQKYALPILPSTLCIFRIFSALSLSLSLSLSLTPTHFLSIHARILSLLLPQILNQLLFHIHSIKRPTHLSTSPSLSGPLWMLPSCQVTLTSFTHLQYIEKVIS